MSQAPVSQSPPNPSPLEAETVAASPRPRPTWKRYFLLRFQWSLIAFAWYLLLIGPLFWTWHHSVTNGEPSWVEYCYRPLVYACEIPVIRNVVNAYIDLWIL